MLIIISVRVSSYAQYNTGLFILDIDRAPWGCGRFMIFVLLSHLRLDSFREVSGLRFGLSVVVLGLRSMILVAPSKNTV